MTRRRSISRSHELLALGVSFALACSGEAEHVDRGARSLVSAESYTAMPEVTFLPPLALARPTTVDFDPSLTDQLAVEVCALAGASCAGAPLVVLSGAELGKLESDGGYSASWDTDGVALPPGGEIRVSVTLAGMTLAALDVDVSADGKQLRTALTDELLGAYGRTLPVRFWVGRTPAIATHSLHAQGKSAVEVAQVLATEFGLAAPEAAALLAGDDYGSVDVGLALGLVFGLPAEPAAEILQGVGFGPNDIALALKDAFQLQADAAAFILKGLAYGHLVIAEAMKDVFLLQAQATAEILKQIGLAHVAIAEAMKDVFLLQAQATAEILKAIGYAAIEVAQVMEDLFLLTAQGVAEVLQAVGYAMEEIIHALEDVFQMTGEAIVEVLHAVGAGRDAILQALMIAFNIDEAAATVILCLGAPPLCVDINI